MKKKIERYLGLIISLLVSISTLSFAGEKVISLGTFEKIGNVFLENEPIKFKLSTNADSIFWEVEDFWGKKVAEGRERIEKGEEYSLSLPLRNKGYFSLKVMAKKDNETIEKIETPFAILSEFDIKKVEFSPFGITTHFGQWWNPEIISLISSAGIKNIRDEIYWGSVEQIKDKFRFLEKHERYIMELDEAGIEPSIVLTYGNRYYDNGNYPVSEEAISGFTRYAREVVSKYNGKYFEVWNEWTGGCGMAGKSKTGNTPENYVKLLEATYKSVKATNPQAVVIGLGGEYEIPPIEQIFKAGALKYMDAVSIHPYGWSFLPSPKGCPEEGFMDFIKKTEELIEKYGGNQPIWITEISWPTHIAHNGVSEKIQAEYLARSYVLALSAGVEKIYWYDFMNDGLKKDYNEHNFGIIRHAIDPRGKYTPKPAYVAYANLTRQLTGVSTPF